MTEQTNGQMLIGKMQDQGGRPNMEDNIDVRPLRTALGLPLLVAMVADGIGGNNCGEVASQLAIETVFSEMEKAAVENAEQIPQLLAYALKQANEAVYRAAKADKTKEGMGTTATLVAIHNHKLYLANVGDSRAYLVRDGRVQQMTVDHTWAREMVRLGHLSPEDAAVHPKGEALVRSIGYSERLEVDLGIYPNGDEEERQARARQGFPLRTNDRLLLCSDGLVKDRYKASGHYVEPDEILQLISRNHADKAAQALVKKAVSRQADDNVSAIVLEMPGSQVAAGVPRGVFIGAAVLLLLLATAAGVFVLLSGRQTVVEGATAVPPTDIPVVIVPTATAVPEMAVSETGADLLLQPGPEGVSWYIGDGERQPAKEVAMIRFATDDLLTLVNGRTAAADRPNITNLILPAQVQLFLDGEAEVQLTAVQGVQDSEETRVKLENGLLLVQVPEGEATRVVIANAFGDEAWLDEPGLMVVQYQDDPFVFMIACLEVDAYCHLTYQDDSYKLVAGESICFGGGCPVVGAIQPIDVGAYGYLAPGLLVVATAVPTETATEIIAATATNTRRPPTPRPGDPTVTATAAASATSEPGAPPPAATATNPPPPTLTNTPRPGTTATNTPLPTNTPPATNTPQPPTNTPQPPTSTPQPPTNTPQPPTNTPQPPTNTPQPPTNTPQPPTNTPAPPPDTPTPTFGTPPPTTGPPDF
ncbi:MAG TPA: protein phosphatase 2C domain-containing protein [Chloroflexota bacterium]|nr:protein phosphatase 2C domain-containing protein [Chloroflexota bacterium]